MSNTPVSSTSMGVLQFGRTWQLTVSNGTKVMDLSSLRCRFEIRCSDTSTINTAAIRVYNPQPSTIADITGSTNLDSGFTTVTLNVGYASNGSTRMLFSGDIKEFHFGKEQNVDRYLDILAADGDSAFNQTMLNQSLPPGTNYQKLLLDTLKAMNIAPPSSLPAPIVAGTIRGKTMVGMARLTLDSICNNVGWRWSIQNGVATFVPNTSYLPDATPVQIGSATGMIGSPEQTDNGIMIRCYINPLITIGRAVQLNNSDISRMVVPEGAQSGPDGQSAIAIPQVLNAKGLYRVLSMDHVGDTRGSEWYTELTCLAIDPSSAAQGKPSVMPNG